MRQFCASCGEQVCSPSGNSKSLLIIGERPGKAEMEQNKPFATHLKYVTAGKVFRSELERLGVSINDFRITNLLLHEPNDNENCYEVGYEQVLNEAKGKQAILLVGSDVVDTFTGYKVSDTNGLQIESAILSAPIIYSCVNPAQALQFHKGIGEVRFGIEKFIKRLEMEELI